MAQKASWGPKSFETTPRSIRPFSGFTTSVTLKEDSENDTSGTPPTNTRGRELQPLSFETLCVKAAGVDPMAEYVEWCNLVGQNHPFYLGGVKLGPADRFILKSVGVAETEHAEDGTVICMKLSLAFVEFTEKKSAKLAGSGTGSGTSSGDGVLAEDALGLWRSNNGTSASSSSGFGTDDERSEKFAKNAWDNSYEGQWAQSQQNVQLEKQAERQAALQPTASAAEKKEAVDPSTLKGMDYINHYDLNFWEAAFSVDQWLF